MKEKSKYPTLKMLILLDGATEEEKEKGKSENVEVLSFEELEELGKKHRKEPALGESEDLVTIMYTSGTTGLPKGAMLSNRNFLADTGAVNFLGSKRLTISIQQVPLPLFPFPFSLFPFPFSLFPFPFSLPLLPFLSFPLPLLFAYCKLADYPFCRMMFIFPIFHWLTCLRGR